MNSRIRRHNQLFLLAALPALVMLYVAGQLGLMVLGNRAAQASYSDGVYADAEERFLDSAWRVEPWVAPFGAGSAAYRAERYADAVAHLESALADVPEDDECLVRVNLALAHEELGDRFVAQEKPKPAREEFAAGRAVLAEGECSDDAGLEVDGRLQGKSDRAVGGASAQQQTELEPEKKLEKLQQANDEQRRRQRDKAEEPVNEPDQQIHW